MKTIVVTGGCGFIGSNFIAHLLKERPEYQIINVDALTYAGNVANLDAWWGDPRLDFKGIDISDDSALAAAFTGKRIDCIVNFAAESAVDRSIDAPAVFLKTNILGTFNLLKLCQDLAVDRFVQVSTDEVYGSLEDLDPPFTERSPLAPNNPYAASKASADMIVRSFVRTYNCPAIITRCSNNYGPCQHPEKFLPVAITRALEDLPIPLYGTGKNIRDWIHVEDHCAGIIAALERGKAGEIYNFGGNQEISNVDLARNVLRLLHKPESLLAFVPDRPGHDFRYAMNHAKANAELGWSPKRRLDDGLADTVRWYSKASRWMHAIQTGEYKNRNDAFLAARRGK